MVTRTPAQIAAADAFWEAVGGQPLLDWQAVRSQIIVINAVADEDPDPIIRAEGSASRGHLSVVRA